MMNSLDTNILVYASDEDAAEFATARKLVASMLDAPDDWILSDQILFEYYKALRNPRIFRKPLGPKQAALRLRFLQAESGISRCCHELEQWDDVMDGLQKKGFPYQRTHDLVLSCTLRANGVTRFFTRNTKDFQHAGFSELINPIDG